jgi:hypothetical protein
MGWGSSDIPFPDRDNLISPAAFTVSGKFNRSSAVGFRPIAVILFNI